MNEWISLTSTIIFHAPNIVKAFGKDWLYSEASLANQNSTEPSGTSPIVAILLKLAKTKNIDAIIYFDSVIKDALMINSKRIKELKSKAGLTDGSTWQSLTELSLLQMLPKDFLKYDETEDSVRTPDFRINLNGEDIGIEHVAPSEGEYLKTKQRESKETLDLALRVSKLLDDAKMIYDEQKQIPPLTKDEHADIARAYGKQLLFGSDSLTITDEELKNLIENHVIEETRSFTTMYVSTRMSSRADLIRYLTQCKPGGAQVKDCTWKILAISLGNSHFDKRDVDETSRLSHPNDSSNVRLWSGVVWHAMYGEPGGKIYCGVEDSLAIRGIKSLTETSHGYGLLNDEMEPWHAVIISIFKSANYNLASPSTLRTGGDLIPLDLRASRYLFLNRKKISLRSEIIDYLVKHLGIERVIS